jgi:hypothetical protein
MAYATVWGYKNCQLCHAISKSFTCQGGPWTRWPPRCVGVIVRLAEPSTHEIFLAISTTAVSAGEGAYLPRELMKSV